MLLFCTKLHKITLVKNGWPLKVNGEDHKKQDLYFEMLLFSEKGYKVTLMPFPVKSDHRDKQERTHYDFFTLYHFMEQQTKTVIFQLYISCTLTLSNRQYHGTTNLTIVTEKQKHWHCHIENHINEHLVVV